MESKTFQEAAKNKDHLSMMRHPYWWSRRPLLPLRKLNKSGEGFPWDTGFLIEGKGPVVYIGNVFGISLEGSKRFKSLEEIVADGWEVD